MQPNFYEQVERGIIVPMIAWLCEETPRRVLDAGCGSGETALFFAAHGCDVFGMDSDPEAIQDAQAFAEVRGFSGQVQFRQGNIYQLPVPDDTFDLVWSSSALHHIGDKLTAVRELTRVLKAGGRLAIREGGMPLQMLPYDIGLGEPGLQDRLTVANTQWFTAMLCSTLPQAVPYPYGWLQLLRDVGLRELQARTFMQDFSSPLNEAQSEWVRFHLQRVLDRDRGAYGPLLNAQDRAVVEQLLDPQSPRYVLHRTDLHVRYGLSVYTGRKA